MPHRVGDSRAPPALATLLVGDTGNDDRQRLVDPEMIWAAIGIRVFDETMLEQMTDLLGGHRPGGNGPVGAVDIEAFPTTGIDYRQQVAGRAGDVARRPVIDWPRFDFRHCHGPICALEPI